ncbi:MAG: hypothetical protein CG440_341 [Methanosaeta sp. NSM2]|nr:protease inhibitor I42 family protein [Methanothrix sp.]OYV14774.1 MAG: hypothetical protein CG440_341 [Methanosaeta sp. NSM2]
MSEIVVTGRDGGKTFEVMPNDVIVFRLKENLTTGYGWEVEAVKGSGIDLMESNYIEAAGMAVGRGGTRIMRFLARSLGDQEIRLKYQFEYGCHLSRPQQAAGCCV